MKSIVSTLIILSAVSSSVLAAPSASSASAIAAVHSASALPSAAAVPSADIRAARAERWSRMKIALPDGLFPEDIVRPQKHRVQKREHQDIVPMIVIDEADLPMPSLVNKPLYKNQRPTDGKPAYKHMGLAQSEETFDPMRITLLPPNMQSALSKQHEQLKVEASQSVDAVPVAGTGRRYKNFIGLSDNGVTQSMSVPIARASSLPESHEVEEEEFPQGVQQKKLVGLDKNGRMRFLDIPYYNRGSS